TLFKKVGKAVLNRHKKSETYKQVSDCLSSGGSVNRSLSDLRWASVPGFLLSAAGDFPIELQSLNSSYLTSGLWACHAAQNVKLEGNKGLKKLVKRANKA
ncbi:hypothetical protein, partial [Shewanella algae]|uniref:hypothetical protein n=1 Tax=Shewanella algae TaxID=38313 RepID=UPI0031F48483